MKHQLDDRDDYILPLIGKFEFLLPKNASSTHWPPLKRKTESQGWFCLYFWMEKFQLNVNLQKKQHILNLHISFLIGLCLFPDFSFITPEHPSPFPHYKTPLKYSTSFIQHNSYNSMTSKPSDDQLRQAIDAIFNKYDSDKSGTLEGNEIFCLINDAFKSLGRNR